MKQIKLLSAITIMISVILFSNHAYSQQIAAPNKQLSLSEKSIISISSFTAQGKLRELKIALIKGLEAGLTVNEIKEILVHLYAYCGFPRSIRGLQTFMEVLNERKKLGITDSIGREASPIKDIETKYEHGKMILEELTKTPQPNQLNGYAAFAPVIDTFLKEHLFADIFERDLLTYAQRELVTISVIASIGNAEPMLRSHLVISLNLGFTEGQLKEFGAILKSTIAPKEALVAENVILGIIKEREVKK
ncbi:carboxymuconolactone decarboxylase [Pedobacter cryophilus]|uniref:Carboxymuconolactone decarboxylase n=1 Tax=Pedobacter cryophilus TaxID=2571271 RepID=A0A4V6WMZ7_9SPHI|nr:carboxymuconolactone decarboxylase [Pedobacter cryophilus]